MRREPGVQVKILLTYTTLNFEMEMPFNSSTKEVNNTSTLILSELFLHLPSNKNLSAMKKLLLTLLSSFAILMTSAQTAPDFTATDCNGTSHNLYTELAQGKVIVIVWVMPCGACTGPALTAYNIVQSYASSNVLYYLIDDAGNTSCTSLSSWASGASVGTNRTTFSTASIVESNYGGVGMPHVAVVGLNGHMYFNALNSAAGNSTNIQNGINSALAATGINEANSNPFQLLVSPSLSGHSVKVTYSLRESANITLDIMNEAGQLVTKKDLGKQSAGDYTSDFDLAGTASGIYFMRFSAANNAQTVKFVVSH